MWARSLTISPFLFVLALPAVSWAAPVELNEDFSHFQLGPHTEYLAEEGKHLTIEQVSSPAFSSRFKPSESEIPSFGFTKDAHWFRVRVQSRHQETEKFMLEIPHPVLDHIEYYAEKPGGGFERYTVGESYPYGNKVVRHYHFIFPVSLAPGQSRWIYLRVQTTGSLQVPLDLWTNKQFVGHTQDEQLFYGVLAGFLLVMVFYNLFLFLAIRDSSYLYYVLFVATKILQEGAVRGLTQEYIFPGSPTLSEYAYTIGGLGTTLFVTLFTIRFMDLPRLLPLWSKICKAYVGINIVALLATPVLPYTPMVKFLALWAGVGTIICMLVAIFAVVRGFKSARYYLAAWTVFLVCIFMFVASKFGLLPRSGITENGALIGLGLNVVLLSLALADRINVLRREKEQMQRQALEVQRRAAETLEQQVQERTQELKQAYEQLAEHDRLKSRFFANVSHEVRTPLTLILAPLQRLLGGEGGSLPEAAGEKLRAMVGNVQRLLRLVNQLLDFSRLESGGTTVSFERMDIGPMVETIARSFEGFAQGKGIKLGIDRPETLPEVYVDPPKLDKVVSNLLSNACKFTEPGGKVMVRLKADESSLSIAVTDTGIGIPEDELPHIFERFHQVDGSASRKHEGSGIGLALSMELTNLLGGNLAVESRPAMGSTFTVTLPLGTEHIKDPSLISSASDSEVQEYSASAAQEAAAALAVEAAGDRRSGEALAEEEDGSITPTGEQGGGTDGRPLVLVVEDNPDMRSLVREICEKIFTVREAPNGQRALELIRRRRPALVISDIMMPVMDGYELVRQIRADPATESLPVLLLTAKAGPEMLAEGLECGANDYLAKPFETQELLARARNLVRLEEQDRQLRTFNARLQEELVAQSAELERARLLGRYVSPALVHSIMVEGVPVLLEQQRLRLTVFLMELRGFDTLAEENLDPEEVTAMLNGYLSAMMEVALSHGATVDKLNQDVVGGFFGAPTSDGPERDAIRCARMALQMWERAVQICNRWRGHQLKVPPIPTSVLVSGFATVGNFGSTTRLEYTAVGTPVNHARLLLPAVKAGTVVCTRSTWSLIKNEVASEFSESVKAPQWTSPLDLYRLSLPTVPGDETVDLPITGPSVSSEVKILESASRPTVSSGSGSGRPSQDPKDLRQGAVLGERYVVQRRLGAGGMGVVYKVEDLKLETAVALKLIMRDLRGNPQFLKRLYREVKLARLVTHPNVARIYDLGEWEGLEFITMEYIEGETLSKRLKQGGILEPVEGLDAFRQICSGLAAAHLAGIVHRDLKPSNIMIDASGRVTIMDFGIARWADPVDGTGTESRGISGTPSYMAPEQFTGAPMDMRTDIYALGCVAYEIFTGAKPFSKGDMAHMCFQHTQVTPPPPIMIDPNISPRLSAIVMRCLNKKPAERFSSVQEITALLISDLASKGDDILDQPGHEERMEQPKQPEQPEQW